MGLSPDMRIGVDHKDISPDGTARKADGFPWPEGRRPAGGRASGQDTTGVAERGMPPEGSLGNVGEPSVSLGTWPERGTGCPKALAWAGGFDLITSPAGRGRTHGSRQGSGARAPSKVLRDGQGGSRRGAESLGRGETVAHGPHGREGDAGHHVVLESTPGETVRAPTVTPKLPRIAVQAARGPERVFTPLASRIDEDFRGEAYRPTRQASAPGIAGGTARSSAAPLDEHLRDVHARLRRGRSQAAPVERVWSEKAEGGQRPIGTPACEDTNVQRAVATRREALYAQDFYDGSYGLRQGRSPQEARQALCQRCMPEGRGWRVDADVSGSFDSIDRPRGREVLRPRGNDGRELRLLGKWLRAGVMAHGTLSPPETGVVQGGVLSPVWANVFLPHGLDAWFAREGQPRRQG